MAKNPRNQIRSTPQSTPRHCHHHFVWPNTCKPETRPNPSIIALMSWTYITSAHTQTYTHTLARVCIPHCISLQPAATFFILPSVAASCLRRCRCRHGIERENSLSHKSKGKPTEGERGEREGEKEIMNARSLPQWSASLRETSVKMHARVALRRTVIPLIERERERWPMHVHGVASGNLC